MRVRTALLLALVLVVSCRVPPDPIPRFLPALEPFDPDATGWKSTRPVLLVADCQLHNLYARPIPDRNLSTKMLADTAIRPPQLDLFASDVLEWILEEGAPKTEGIIHVGDALDLACEGELREFLDVMKKADEPWLMAPGNHECFYFGSYDPGNRDVWQDACECAGAPITKDRYVRLYVAAILYQDDPGIEALAKELGLFELRNEDFLKLSDRIPESYRFEAPEGTGGFLDAIEWKIDRDHPWRSYILQRADLTGQGEDPIPFHAILLDSCQYAQMPTLVPNAWDNYPVEYNCGLLGEMLADQLRTVRRWLEEEDVAATMVSHHPVNNLASKTRSSLYWLWSRTRTSGYITAHTHTGHFVHHDLGDGNDGLELNVGSTSDWPMEWRNFVVHYHRDRREVYLWSERFTLADALANREGFFKREWEVPVGAADDYRKYKMGETTSGTIGEMFVLYHLVPPVMGRPKIEVSQANIDTEAQVKDTLLWTYHRLIREFPTDTDDKGARWPGACGRDSDVLRRIERLAGLSVSWEEKVPFLQQLEIFEKSRATKDAETGRSTDDERVRFKISQAVWASRFEVTHGRKLRPEDELVRVRVREQWGTPPKR